MCSFQHSGHDVRVREWSDFAGERLTGVTVDCETCGEEVAFFAHDGAEEYPEQDCRVSPLA